MACDQWERGALRDKLTGALIGLARATEGNEYLLTDSTAAVVAEGLCATGSDSGCDESGLVALLERVDAEKRKLVPGCYLCASPCGRTNDYCMQDLQNAPKDLRSLRLRILFAIRGIAGHACCVPNTANVVCDLLYRGLYAVGRDDWGMEELMPIVQEAEERNRKF